LVGSRPAALRSSPGIGLPDQLLVAISAALEDNLHPGDADRLVALGRALGLLGRLGFDEPEFLCAVQASRDVLASRVEAVLAEARQEAGDDPVDPRLLLALTEALAATFDPGYH
jgi:AcrR family transcriptional regulator